MKELFVSIVSYRDLDVLKTVPNLLASAYAPEQIRICVVIQDDSSRWELYKQIKSNQVELHFFDLEWAEGCGKARAEVFRYYDGEKYFFQTDSHMRFEQDWDLQLKKELEECESERPILTTLPPYFVTATEERGEPAFCRLKFLKFYENIPLHIGYSTLMKDYRPTAKPVRTPFMAGGVLFSYGRICKELKYDPYFYFHGEEFSTNLRLWTMGYDNFLPRFCFCYHAYRTRQINEAQTIAVVDPAKDKLLHSRSIQRMQVLMGVKDASEVQPSALIELEKYGLGNVRTIRDWESTFGIDLKSQTVHGSV